VIAHEVRERERQLPARIDDAKLVARIDPRLHAPSVAGDRRPRDAAPWGGDVVDFAKVIDAITAARADIVGLQEAEGNTQRIAEAPHWPYWSDCLHLVSRFPLIDPPERTASTSSRRSGRRRSRPAATWCGR